MKKRILSMIMAAVMLLPVLVIPSGAAAKLDKPVISVSVEGDNPVISWNAVKNAADYYVYRLNFETRKYTKIADIKDLTFTDTKVKSDTLQQYIVIAVDENKNKSDKSSPKNTIAKPTNLKATATTDSVKLTWSKSLNATHYVVEQATGSSNTYKAIKSTKNASITITGLKSGTSYKFRIRPRVTVNDKYYYGLRSSAVKVSTKQTEKILVKDGVPRIDVSDKYPAGSYFAAVAMIMKMYGYDVDQDELYDMLPRREFVIKNGIKTIDYFDRAKYCYGDAKSYVYYCGPSIIKETMESYFKKHNITDLEVEKIYAFSKPLPTDILEMSNDIPLIVWGTVGMKITPKDEWYSELNKATCYFSKYEQVYILLNYDKAADKVTLIDPFNSSENVIYNAQDFMEVFDTKGRLVLKVDKK